MSNNTKCYTPNPIVNRKELISLDDLTRCYNKLIEPSKIAMLGKTVGGLVPEKVKAFGADITKNITAQELYQQSMELIAKGFNVVEEQAAKYSISEKTILKKVNKIIPDYDLTEISEICLFNLVLSTFLYFRAVQAVAMFYGYDVKNDSAEMLIASEVFSNALSPAKNDVNNEMTSTISKVMIMTQASVVKQTEKKLGLIWLRKVVFLYCWLK